MSKHKHPKQVAHLDAAVLPEKQTFTIVFLDGQEMACNLLELGQFELHVLVEGCEFLVPKHAVKYYVLGVREKKPAVVEEDEEEVSRLKVTEIEIPGDFQQTHPNKDKVANKIRYYREHGRFDTPVTVKKKGNGWLLTDGYSRYIAAREMGLEEVEVTVAEAGGVHKGTVKRILEGQSYGFITLKEGGANVFFHSSALEGVPFEDLQEGMAVECEVEEEKRGLRAVLVRRLEDEG